MTVLIVCLTVLLLAGLAHSALTARWRIQAETDAERVRIAEHTRLGAARAVVPTLYGDLRPGTQVALYLRDGGQKLTGAVVQCAPYHLELSGVELHQPGDQPVVRMGGCRVPVETVDLLQALPSTVASPADEPPPPPPVESE